jgi:hypothetical protein
MTTTWGTLLDEVRVDVSDTSSNEKYSDAVLYTYLKDAVRDYSTWFPKRVDSTVLSGSGSGPYTLPSDFIEALFVEAPANYFLERRQPRPGARYPRTTGRPFNYYIDGGALYLDSAPILGDEDVILTYNSVHDLPATAADAAFVFTVPDADIELLRLYIKAKVFETIRSKASRLDRFNDSPRDDNPVAPEVRNVMREYRMKIAERYPGGAIMLARIGRTR